MTTKRPWTENTSHIQFNNEWYVVDSEDRAVAEVVSDNSEADARLFAAAQELYEALEELAALIRRLQMATVIPYSPETLANAEAALRAANPCAFESAEGEGE